MASSNMSGTCSSVTHAVIVQVLRANCWFDCHYFYCVCCIWDVAILLCLLVLLCRRCHGNLELVDVGDDRLVHGHGDRHHTWGARKQICVKVWLNSDHVSIENTANVGRLPLYSILGRLEHSQAAVHAHTWRWSVETFRYEWFTKPVTEFNMYIFRTW